MKLIDADELKRDFIKSLSIKSEKYLLPSERSLYNLIDKQLIIEQRPKGKWIRVDSKKVRCSNCEIIHLIAQYPMGKIDFCPNCGADMREVEE